MNQSRALHPLEFIDNYFPVIDGVTETVHQYARHMDAVVVCPEMERHYLQKHSFSYQVLTCGTLRIPFSRYACAVPHLDRKLAGKIAQQGYTLVPLQVYFKGSLVKVEFGLAKGKKLYDKRQDIAKKDQRREAERDFKVRNL